MHGEQGLEAVHILYNALGIGEGVEILLYCYNRGGGT